MVQRTLAVFIGLMLFWGQARISGAQPSDPPIIYQYSPLKSVATDYELVIAGHNPHATAITLVIRCDDTSSHDYSSRVNEERSLPPGAFTVRLALGNIRTPQGRHLNLQAIRELHVFTLSDSPPLEIEHIRFEAPEKLSADAIGWDFGPPDSAIFPGFERVAPGDKRLQGSYLQARRRPSGDALISDGIQGIEQFRAPIPNGRWHVSLWTEDLGEWEYLPHFQKREIVINGINIKRDNISSRDWITQRYLAGKQVEAMLDGDPWALFGARRGGLIEADIQIEQHMLNIELRGDSPNATYLAAVLIEPSGSSHPALESVQAARQKRFNETWRHIHVKNDALKHEIIDRDTQTQISNNHSLYRTAAPETWVEIDIDIYSKQSYKATIKHTPPTDGTTTFPSELRWGQWSYQRKQAQSTLLEMDANNLVAYSDSLLLSQRLPRRVNVRVLVPSNTPTGLYKGQLTLLGAQKEETLEYIVDVIDAQLPAPDKPIGVYLENAPYFDWFADLGTEREQAARCDLEYLRRLGITGLAPPMSTPIDDQVKAFVTDLQRLNLANFTQPMLAYTPVKRLAERYQGNQLAQYMQRVAATIQAFKLPQPIWSIADEPSNPSQTTGNLAELSQLLHHNVKGIRLAGHLNHAEDRKYVSLFDVVLINHGYGADYDHIADIKEQGVEPWLYNLSHYRLAAGFYLWRVGAKGYLQWHARMPTADPFDPTDGREADFYFLLPQSESCPAVPDARDGLFEIVEGITDLRWLQWLEHQAAKSPTAVELIKRLRNEIPSTWSKAEALDNATLSRWRNYITNFAKNLNSPAKQNH